MSAPRDPRPPAAPSSVGQGACARDRVLVDRIARGEASAAEALSALFDSYAPTSLAVARRVTQHQQLAEEVVQEVFVALWTSPGSYDAARGTVRAYLLTSVHHRAVDAVRREQTQRWRHDQQAQGLLHHAPDVAEEVIARTEDQHRQAAVTDALAGLPAEQRRVLLLMYFEGKSQQVIAEELAVPLGTVKSRALLAMRKLRVVLAVPTWPEG